MICCLFFKYLVSKTNSKTLVSVGLTNYDYEQFLFLCCPSSPRFGAPLSRLRRSRARALLSLNLKRETAYSLITNNRLNGTVEVSRSSPLLLKSPFNYGSLSDKENFYWTKTMMTSKSASLSSSTVYFA